VAPIILEIIKIGEGYGRGAVQRQKQHGHYQGNWVENRFHGKSIWRLQKLSPRRPHTDSRLVLTLRGIKRNYALLHGSERLSSRKQTGDVRQTSR
jgi:hypothetical protein